MPQHILTVDELLNDCIAGRSRSAHPNLFDIHIELPIGKNYYWAIIGGLTASNCWPYFDRPWREQPWGVQKGAFGLITEKTDFDAEGIFEETFPGLPMHKYGVRLRKFLNRVMRCEYIQTRMLIWLTLQRTLPGFWIAGASSSAKYHQVQIAGELPWHMDLAQNDLGGLLNHCVDMANRAPEIIKRQLLGLELRKEEITLIEHALVAATLLHDIAKGANRSSKKPNTPPFWFGFNTDHGQIAAELVRLVAKENSLCDQVFPLPDGYGNEITLAQAIWLAILEHSGQWEAYFAKLKKSGVDYLFSRLGHMLAILDMTSTGRADGVIWDYEMYSHLLDHPNPKK